MSQTQAFSDNLVASDITFEEGTIRGRAKQNFPGLTPALDAAKVNGPEGDKGQYIWMGLYTVQLDRGLTISDVAHLCQIGNTGAQDQRCLPYGERVTVTWLNRKNNQIPVILEGTTLDFYDKQLFGLNQLLDPGERIIRSAMASTPGATGDFPFADNQFDNPASSPDNDGKFDQNSDSVIRNPGAETFYDKFGRLIMLTRNPGNEYLVTHGKTDTGQDDVSALKKVADQDSYYELIENDESKPTDIAELMAPKPINLVQYRLVKKELKVEGDPDPNRTVTRGILPRFDKWKFQPIVIRKYQADTDGEKLPATEKIYATHQERQNTVGDKYGFVKTITDQGDMKLFVPRHINARIGGDTLISVKGNTVFQVKATYDDTTGSLMRASVLADGTTEFFLKAGGGTASDYNLKITALPDGTLSIDSKKTLDIKVTGGEGVSIVADSSDISLVAENVTLTSNTEVSISTDKAIITAKTSAIIDSADVTITGGNLTVAGTAAPTPGEGPFCAIPNCIFSGAPHIGKKVMGT